jgi:hypothetical protein
MMSTMTGRPVPGPPPHIAALMAEAGRYLGWLHDNGWITDGRQK